MVNVPEGEVPELFCLICQNPEEKQGQVYFSILDLRHYKIILAGGWGIKKPKTTAQE